MEVDESTAAAPRFARDSVEEILERAEAAVEATPLTDGAIRARVLEPRTEVTPDYGLTAVALFATAAARRDRRAAIEANAALRSR